MSNLILTGSDELEQFYKNKFYFSYSSINKLLFSPIAFYNHYVLNQREDSTDAHLVAGRALHCLLLEPDNFDDYFLTLPGKLPTDSQRKIIDNIFRIHHTIGNNSLLLEDYSTDILTQLLTANLYQSLKTDQQRIEKILTEENKEYFEFLKQRVGKTVIDQETLNGCKVSIEIIKSNVAVRSLLQLDRSSDDDHLEVYNECAIQADYPWLPFGFKGVLDNVVVDRSSKTLFINDLKTTSKSIQDFPDSVQYYKYWIQAVIYALLASNKYLENEEKDEWKIQITFIVIDKYNQLYPFQVSLETLAKWKEDFNLILTQVKWHYANKKYELPYELAIGNVKL
jgi:hypothetical protein